MERRIGGLAVLAGALLIGILVGPNLQAQVAPAPVVKVGIQSPGLNLIPPGPADFPTVISLLAFTSGSPSALSGGVAMEPVPTPTTPPPNPCAALVTGSETRTLDATITLTGKQACDAGFQGLTVIITAYLSTGQITVQLFSPAALIATYTGTGTVTIIVGCLLQSNQHHRLKF